MRSIYSLLFIPLLMLSHISMAMTTVEGEEDKVEHYLGNGKWTIVEVWKSDCHSCRQHMPEMVEFDGKLKNVRLLGITLDGQEGVADAKGFIADFGIKFPTLVSSFSELSGWMMETLEEPLIGTPTFILFDEAGKVIAAQAGVVPVASLEKFIVNNSGDHTGSEPK